MVFRVKQDSKELNPKPLANAPTTFNSKKLFKLLMLKVSLRFNAENAPKTFISVKNSSNMFRLVLKF